MRSSHLPLGACCTACLASLLACATTQPLTIRPAGQPKVATVQPSFVAPADASQGMTLANSNGSQCYTDQNGGIVCPTVGAPIRKMPPLLHPDSPQGVALQGQDSHPACYSGSQSVPCDESFRLPEAVSVAEDE